MPISCFSTLKGELITLACCKAISMAVCGSLRHIFENPTLLESLSSRNQIKPAHITEIFGELHYKENPQSPSASSFSSTSIIGLNPQNSVFKLSRNDTLNENDENDINSSSSSEFFSSAPKIIKYTESFSLNSESLQLCTEGLGFESSDDVEDMKIEMKEDYWRQQISKEKKASSVINTTKHGTTESFNGVFRKSRSSSSLGAFPPPISCIGKSGKPWVCFKSYRQDGRFVLKEVRIPTRELLHACREDGRLKLHFLQPNHEVLKDEEFEEGDEIEDLEEGLINDDIDHEGQKKWQTC